MNCPHCRKGWVDIDVAGEVEHDLCSFCNGTGRTPAELAAMVRELREALAAYRKHDPYFMDDNLLAKSEGV
jgi:Zn-finger nucleic acid-binding protein